MIYNCRSSASASLRKILRHPIRLEFVVSLIRHRRCSDKARTVINGNPCTQRPKPGKLEITPASHQTCIGLKML